jgi:hypothetical protein
VIGRPTNCTTETTAVIANARGVGMSWARAAALANVSVDAVHDWRAKGAAGEQPYADFLRCCERARSEWVERQLAIIQDAATDGTWQASAWLLERGEPDDYSLRNRTQHEGAVQVSGNVGLDVRSLVDAIGDTDPERLRALAGDLTADDQDERS